MFQRVTIVVLGLLLFVAVIRGQVGLALLCVLLLVTALMARLWSNWALRRVSYERQLSQTRAFPDDLVDMTVKLTNRKILPLAAIRVLDRIPNAFQVLQASVSPSGTRQSQILQRRTSLRWYESVVWHYQIRCPQRGAYRIGPVELVSGDPFGLYTSDSNQEVYTSLLVYPRLLSLAELGLPAHNPLGDIRAGQLLRDPLRIVGVRDYMLSDPLKDIHWGATARTGQLQTRIYEPTTARVLAIFLDLDTFEFYYEGVDLAQVEHMISAAATLAQTGLEEGYAVGFYANGAPAEHEQLARLPAGRSPAQLGQIMETLARLTAYSVTNVSRLLKLTTPELPSGTTILLIGSVNSEAVRASLLRQRQLGYRVVWLFMGQGETPQLAGVQVYRAPYVSQVTPQETEA